MGRELDRGNVAAACERVTGANRPEKFAIEIFRIVFAETAWRVGEDRERMNESLFERERVDKRLQCRTGGALAACAINLTVDLDLVEISRADLREHIHRSGVHEKGGGIFNSAIAAEHDVIRNSTLDRTLLLQIERCYDFISAV